MQLKSRRTLAVTAAAVVLTGTVAAVAAGQKSHSKSPSAALANTLTASSTIAPGKGALLDDVAKRLGIERSKLDSALQQIALDEIDWAVDAGFLSKDQGDLLKQRIKAGDGRFGHGFGHFLPGGHLFGANSFLAAAQYLGLSAVELENALDTKTLAQVANDKDKSVDGLKKALTAATKEALDDARGGGRITQKQENALLDRYEANLDDVVNGRSPEITRLAKELGFDRAKVEAAFKAARMAQIDQAVADGRLTKEQGDALKNRIESGGGGFGPGFGHGGFGHGGLGDRGPGHGGGRGDGFRAGPAFGLRTPAPSAVSPSGIW